VTDASGLRKAHYSYLRISAVELGVEMQKWLTDMRGTLRHPNWKGGNGEGFQPHSLMAFTAQRGIA